MRKLSLWLMVVVPGALGVVVFGGYSIVDYALLMDAMKHFQVVAGQATSTVRDVVIADGMQNVHRLNVFAEGVWALLSAVCLAIGLHGLCLLPRTMPTEPR